MFSPKDFSKISNSSWRFPSLTNTVTAMSQYKIKYSIFESSHFNKDFSIRHRLYSESEKCLE